MFFYKKYLEKTQQSPNTKRFKTKFSSLLHGFIQNWVFLGGFPIDIFVKNQAKYG